LLRDKYLATDTYGGVLGLNLRSPSHATHDTPVFDCNKGTGKGGKEMTKSKREGRDTYGYMTAETMLRRGERRMQ
jgi:hypothetical protein